MIRTRIIEVAAHSAAVTSIVLVPIVASKVKVPLIAAGLFNGRGLAAALMLGTDAISMGTRFMLTKEGVVHDYYENLCLKGTEEDTYYDNVFDGLPSRVLKSKGLAAVLRKQKMPLLSWFKSAMVVKGMLNLLWGQFVTSSVKMMTGEGKRSLFEQARYANSIVMLNKAMYEGNETDGFMYAGQV